MTKPIKNWACPKCGAKNDQTFCGQCGFRIIPNFDRRLIAYLMDWFALSAFSLLSRHISVYSRGAYLALHIIQLLFFFTYLVVFLKYWGQTPGKMLMGIKVARLDGLPLRWSDICLRYAGEIGIWLLWVVVALCGAPPVLFVVFGMVYLGYGFGDTLVALKNIGYRAIHNFISGTVVVNNPQSKQMAEEAPDFQ